ncbi:putative transcriptional regulator YdeE [Pseudomonas duriflava]|uniref:Putative transcriptional regulator YdeE n=1 Tax=Pseudomonas duriflava TaxID=459528 RepID=A0A562QDL5_9PSED|nr:GyrI-like domain-containing protein [Pseudomonas duriflava]TWI54842.1 putative transcriptional regulator YdeE [Pseudomonas duriflava]
MPFSIVELPAFTVIGLEYIADGQGGSIAELWHTFFQRADALSVPTPPHEWFGLILSPPPAVLRYVAGIKVDEDTATPEGMIRCKVPAQKYLQFSHVGLADNIPDTYDYLYGRILPGRGLEPKKAISFEHYDKRFNGPEDERSIVDIYLPIF